jgi:PAS domain S-box-containing protein
LRDDKAFRIPSNGGVLAAGVALLLVIPGAGVVLALAEKTAVIVAGGFALAGGVIALIALLALREIRARATLQEEVRVSSERLSGVIQSAMDAIITVDERQNIVLFNAAAERTFGCSAAEAIGGPLDRFIPERFRDAHRRHVERFGATGTTSRQMGAPSLQLVGLRKGGEEFPIDASISQVSAGGGKLYTVILRDITNRRRFEEALELAYHERRQAADQLRGILQSAMDAVITTGEDQKIILFNEAAERIFRCKAEHAVHGPLDRFIPERFQEAHREHVRRFGETRVTTRMMGPRRQLVGLRADGEEFPLDASISQVTVDGRKYYTVILRDITEQLAAEEALRHSFDELREMSAAMHDVREAERTRIARELHDELAQWLTAIKMDITWLTSRLPAEQPRLIERADKMKQLVDTTVTAVRRIAADLRPVMLDDLGLVPAIEHVVHAFSERTRVAVSLDLRVGDADLRDPVATAVYRMVQEALTNVARHARATLVTIAVTVEDGMLRVRIQDNGVGISDAPAVQGSHGLLGIRERARTLGGDARIYRPPEGGTVVEIGIALGRFGRPEAA